MTKKLSADFSRRIFLEGRALTRPKISARQEPCHPIFRRMNSALKNFVINHWLKPNLLANGDVGKSAGREKVANGERQIV